MICMLISLVLIAAYIVYAISVMQRIPWSVSDTYYQLDKRGRPKWLFQAAMIVPAFYFSPHGWMCLLWRYSFSLSFPASGLFCRRCALL